MTIKHILNKINIDITTYIIMLISFLAGYFEVVFLTIFSILIHELGHFITASFLNLNVSEIKIFMFGGVTVLDESLTVDIKKELLTLIMGPLTEVIFLLIVYLLHKNGYVSSHTWELFLKINLFLLSFNLLPILPLDGGKLLNNIFDLIFPYNISHNITIALSIMSIPVLLFFNKKALSIFLIIFLLIKNIEEISTHKYKVMRLITERKLKNKIYKKEKLIKNIKNIYRNKNFIIKVNNIPIKEKDYFKYC